MKRIISFLLAIAIICGLSSQVLAYTSGYAGISNYGNCSYGDRAGAQYVTNLQNSISSICTQSFKLTNTNANKYVFQSSWSNSVDFFAYSGHGLSSSTYSSLHFRNIGVDATNHNGADHNDPTKLAKIEARTYEIRMGESLKYATFYSCNFLTNGGSTAKQEEIYKMFEGARLAMGFASIMFIDSREGTYYGNRLVNTSYTIKDSFIAGAERFQVQRESGDSIARVVGYTSASNDKLTTTKYVLASWLWYKNYNIGYSIITTVVIPHTGEPVSFW